MSQVQLNTIDTHSNPDACIEWMRNNWHDLGSHCVEEATQSLEALAKTLGVRVDWSISLVPDRGEYIRFSDASGTNESHGLQADQLNGDCPLTGVCYDECLIDAFRNADSDEPLSEVLQQAGENLLSSIHSEGEHIYSDEGLHEFASANEYTFLPCGQVYS